MPEETKPERKSTPVEKLDYSKPFWIVLHQTTTRNVIEMFQGAKAEKAEKLARDRAREKALSTKLPVAVVGPQIAVLQPPAEPVVEELTLDFGD